MMSDGSLVPVALLGALLGLDVVSFPQAQLSRPLVAATLAGALLGQPGRGLLVGAVLELVALELLPVGASRYPEWGSAAVVGGALFAASPEGRAGALSIVVVLTLVLGWVGGLSMVGLRRLNGAMAHANLDRLGAGSLGTVVGLQLAGLGFDLLRGFALAVVGLALGQPLTRWALDGWSEAPTTSRAVVVGLAATVAGGAVWKLFHAVPRARPLFLGGLALGLAALVLR